VAFSGNLRPVRKPLRDDLGDGSAHRFLHHEALECSKPPSSIGHAAIGAPDALGDGLASYPLIPVAFRLVDCYLENVDRALGLGGLLLGA